MWRDIGCLNLLVLPVPLRVCTGHNAFGIASLDFVTCRITCSIHIGVTLHFSNGKAHADELLVGMCKEQLWLKIQFSCSCQARLRKLPFHSTETLASALSGRTWLAREVGRAQSLFSPSTHISSPPVPTQQQNYLPHAHTDHFTGKSARLAWPTEASAPHPSGMWVCSWQPAQLVPPVTVHNRLTGVMAVVGFRQKFRR